MATSSLKNGRITFFDWGDADVTHPFVSLRTRFVSMEIAPNWMIGRAYGGNVRAVEKVSRSVAGIRGERSVGIRLSAMPRCIHRQEIWHGIKPSLTHGRFPARRIRVDRAVNLLQEFMVYEKMLE
ncbi:MAG: hypothetical protein U0X93_00015 [Anaerolineales bacterium]